MTRKEKIQFIYENSTKEKLVELVEKNKITPEEYKEVTGEECTSASIETLKKSKIETIREYKHEKRTRFDFYGHPAAYGSDDVTLIGIVSKRLASGDLKEVEWVFKDDERIKVNNSKFIDKLTDYGDYYVGLAFTIEKMVVDEIEALTKLDDVITFDEKAKFDLYYDSQPTPPELLSIPEPWIEPVSEKEEVSKPEETTENIEGKTN